MYICIVIDTAISAIPFKYRSKVEFSRVLRDIPQERLAFIKGWGESLQQPADFVESYKHEFLIEEGGMDIWIPMQEQILPFMGNELAVGNEFYVYYVSLREPTRISGYSWGQSSRPSSQ